MIAMPAFLEDETLPAPLFIDVSEFEGTHINPATYLATDYLNHFNEVIMLIEMIPDMPDCMADILEWQPISYAEHFSKSGFKDAELTIKAYHAAPKRIRHRFDSLIADITVSVLEIIKQVEIAVELGDHDALRLIVISQVRGLRSMVDEASGIINGCEHDKIVAQNIFAKGRGGSQDDASQMNVDAIFNAAC